MSKKILQVNFRISVSRTEYERVCTQVAQPIADTPGLRWKVWLMNEREREAGGIYLFDDDASLQAYLAGPIVAAVKSNPALSNINVKQFDVMEQFTAVTRGPIREGARVQDIGSGAGS